MKLAEALLRRKELAAKVEQLKGIKDKDVYQTRFARKSVTDGIDDIVMQVPLLEAGQVMAEYDYYAHQLRLVDSAIQQVNWTVEVPGLDENVMKAYVKPEAPAARGPNGLIPPAVAGTAVKI